jgi:hypothetical protein
VSAGGLTKTDIRQLRSTSQHDDRLWQLAYRQGLRDALRRRPWSFWQLWGLVMVVGLVGDLAWPYRTGPPPVSPRSYG